MLNACAVNAPVQIRSTGDGTAARTGVLITTADEDAGGDRGRFAVALAKAFARRSIASRADDGLIAEYALSTSDASDGIAANRADGSESGTPDWIVAPRVKRRFDRCGAKRLLGTLILFDKTSGSMVYRGQAAQIECDFEQSDIDGMADKLVADALGAIAN